MKRGILILVVMIGVSTSCAYRPHVVCGPGEVLINGRCVAVPATPAPHR